MPNWSEIFDAYDVAVLSRAELIAAGATGRMLTRAVRDNALVRARRDHYCLPHDSPRTIRAVRIGGRVACVSALADYGVFVLDGSGPHLHVDRRMTRLRSPLSRRRRLSRTNRAGAVLHWSPLIDESNAESHRVGLADALRQALHCQPPWLALASIDSALHLGLVRDADLAEVFARTPRAIARLRGLADGRAESGQESVMRYLLLEAGIPFEIQVQIEGVGRVDFLVDGWLIIEADSRLAHAGWASQMRDRERDLAAARLGFATLRPVYQHIMSEPESVLAAIRGLLAERPR